MDDILFDVLGFITCIVPMINKITYIGPIFLCFSRWCHQLCWLVENYIYI